jgi:hypothetical protein
MDFFEHWKNKNVSAVDHLNIGKELCILTEPVLEKYLLYVLGDLNDMLML